MRKTAIVLYLLWCAMLIGIGIYMVRQMSDLTNPSSFNSKMKELKEAIEHENP